MGIAAAMSMSLNTRQRIHPNVDPPLLPARHCHI
jgi:hypothetical protein